MISQDDILKWCHHRIPKWPMSFGSNDTFSSHENGQRRVRSWCQNPLGDRVTYQLKKKKKIISQTAPVKFLFCVICLMLRDCGNGTPVNIFICFLGFFSMSHFFFKVKIR